MSNTIINKNYIGNGIVKQINMITHVNYAKKLFMIWLIDFKNAFDSIDHRFMESVLKALK